MARKKSQSIQRRGRGTPDRFYNPERPPSTSTESFRSISPLIDGTTRMMIDEPKDLNLPSSNENFRPATPQVTTCRKRVLLTARLRTMKSGIDDVRNIINNYKVNGHDTSSFLIQDQLRIQELYEKEIQQLNSLSNSLENLNIQSQPIADATNLPHHSNIATTKNTVKPTPNTVNLPPHTMRKITDDLKNQMKILTTKMPYLRNKKAGQYIKLYTDTFEQHDTLNAFLDNVKFPHYTITPKTQRPVKVVIKGLPRDTKPSDIRPDRSDIISKQPDYS
ncbi:hypothetical protein TNCV_3894061 [Trichonephila clavipes]|nr:hypothetical protein TNCV_3894061 [Trichonephila clavipes]